MTLFFIIYLLIILACLIANALNRHSLPLYFKYFQYLFSLVIFIELGKKVFQIFSISYVFLEHIYQPIELTIFSAIYSKAVNDEVFTKKVKWILFTFWPLSLGLSLLGGIHKENELSFGVNALIMVFYAYVYIKKIYKDLIPGESIIKNSFLWIIVGNLFYYCGDYFCICLDSFASLGGKKAENDLDVIFDWITIVRRTITTLVYLIYLQAFLWQKKFNWVF